MTRYNQTPSGCYVPVDERLEQEKVAAWPGANLDVDKAELNLKLQELYRFFKFHKYGGRINTGPSPCPKKVFVEWAKFMYGGDWVFDGEEYC